MFYQFHALVYGLITICIHTSTQHYENENQIKLNVHLSWSYDGGVFLYGYHPTLSIYNTNSLNNTYHLAHALSLYLHLSLNISPKSYYTLRSTTYFFPINVSSISTHPHQHLIMNNICLLPSFHINPIQNNNSSQNVAQYISYLLTNSL